VENAIPPPQLKYSASSPHAQQSASNDEESLLFENEVFANDRKGDDLRFIVGNLQQLKNRTHYDAYFEGVPVAHFLIINVPPPLPGDDVVQHCLDNFVL
jgi:hypothetical protein